MSMKLTDAEVNKLMEDLNEITAKTKQMKVDHAKEVDEWVEDRDNWIKRYEKAKTDHAAEVSALRAMAEDVMLMSDDLGLDTETPEAIISATSDKVRLAVRALLEDRDSLRAQLEAAKAEAADALYTSRLLTAQLTAQPSVLRDIAALPVDSDSSAKAITLAKVALGLPMPTYKSVAEMEQALTAQPEGVRDTAMRLEGARIVLKDCGWSNTGYASIILEEIAALSTTPGASENLLRERGSRKCAVCGADWQHHVYQQTKEDYPHEFEQALTTPAASAPPEGKVRRLEDMTETELRILLGQVMQALAAPHSQGD